MNSLYENTIKIIKKTSILGVLLTILAIIIAGIGFKEYQNQYFSINAKYELLLSVAQLSVASKGRDNLIDQLQNNLQTDPKLKEIAIQKTTSEYGSAVQEVYYQMESLKQQQKEELDNRLFNLLAYISFSISILIFGISLFWRKTDSTKSEVFQQTVLTELSKQNLNIEKVNNIQNAQNKNLKLLQAKIFMPNRKKTKS